MYPDTKTVTIEPQIEVASLRVSQATSIDEAAVPRVGRATTKAPAAAPIDQTPRYITQDEDENNNETQRQYNTRANASANQVFEVNNLSVKVAMTANEIPTNN